MSLHHAPSNQSTCIMRMQRRISAICSVVIAMMVLGLLSAMLDLFAVRFVAEEYEPQFHLVEEEDITTCGGSGGCQIPNYAPPKPTPVINGSAAIIPQPLRWEDMAPVIEVKPVEVVELTEPGEF